MKKRVPPCFDDTAIAAAMLGNVRKPRTFDRQGRIALIGELAEALISGQQPSREAALFVGGALSSWLTNDGSLEKDYLKVSAKAGSHHTPAYVWKTARENSSSQGARGSEKSEILEPSSTDRSNK